MSNEGRIKSYNVGIGLFELSSTQREQKRLSKCVFQYCARVLDYYGVTKDGLMTATTDGGSEVKCMIENSEYFGLRREWCLSHVLNLVF